MGPDTFEVGAAAVLGWRHRKKRGFGMEMKGISVGFTDCDADADRDFNRWYDLDHVPENIALPEIVTARRYVATDDLLAARDSVTIPELADGAGRYIACYLMGVDDFALVEKKMKDLFDDLWKVRRIFKRARVKYSDKFRLVHALAGKDVDVGPEAVPYLGHSYMNLALTVVEDPGRVEEVEQWWNEVHIPDLVSVPGILGAMRFESVMEGRERTFMFQFLLDRHPKEMSAAMAEASKEWADQGRLYKQEDRPHTSIFRGAFQLIAPMHYDFARSG